MVLPFPSRVSFGQAFLFGALLSGLLLNEGNDLSVCLIIFLQVLVLAIGFNLAGGFRRPSGAYFFFCVLFTSLMGCCVKAALDEPIVGNAPGAEHTLLIYLCGNCMIVAAIALSRRLAPKKAFLSGRLTQENTSRVVIGCIAGGIGVPSLLGLIFGYGNGGISSIVRQLNIALPLSVLIAVYQQSKASDGRSTFTIPALVGWGYSTLYGLLSYSKEAMFASTLAWIVAAAAARARVSLLQLIIAIPSLVIAVAVLFPYAQYGRNFRAETAADWHVATNLLAHPLKLREDYNAAVAAQPKQPYIWFNDTHGIFDRLNLVPIDSALIERTDAVGPIGLTNVWLYFGNIIPHFLWPGKPDLHTGNDYAHEIGLLAEDDHSTGISFSPYAEAYHLAGWPGIFFVLPGITFLLFFMMELIVGSTDEAPWALFFITAFGHIAAEGALTFPVYVMSIGMEAIVATAFFMIYVTPIFGSLIVGPERAQMRRIRPVGSLPRRAPATR